MPKAMYDRILHLDGLRWHDPISVVGVPSHSYGYGVVAPPRNWDRGIATRPTPFPITLLREPVMGFQVPTPSVVS